MPEKNGHNIKDLQLRAKLPQYFRTAAIGVLGVTILVVGIGFYRARNNPEFRMKGFPTELSKDVVAEVNGYERRETEGDIVKYYIRADKAATFADNHQEMENVYLQVFDETGTNFDQITAAKAVYVPAENKNFTAYLAGNVNIETRDSLKVKTEQVTYKREEETATAEELVEFERENVKGRAFGATVKIKEKRLELLRDVEIETYESPELAKANIRQAKITSGFAAFDQLNEKIELQHAVYVNILSKSPGNNLPRTTDVRSERAAVFFSEKAEGKNQLEKLELIENVKIETKENDGSPTKIDSGYALYQKDMDRFDLKSGVNIVTVQDEKPTTIRSAEAVYEQLNGKIFLKGDAELTQGNDYIKGDNVFAELFSNKKLKSSIVRGNAYLKQTTPERTTEVFSGELNAAFNENQHLQAANAIGQSHAVLTPVNSSEYSKVTLAAPKAIRIRFKGEGLMESMLTDGRTTIQLDVPDSSPDSANKRVTADIVRTFFNPNGKDLQKAEAVGNAELFVEPLHASAENYKTTVNAPRFDCEFFPTGNNARNCTGGVKTKTVRVPTVQADNRGTQTILADRLDAFFSPQSRDVEKLVAAGRAKFTELDRNAISSEITFTSADQTVRLRGGEPTAWDSRARAKAREIDWDTRNQKSFLRGGVSTTYYSQKQTGGAAPFTDSNKPVFITSETAEFDHRLETGTYLGNARGWQEKNYVRADRFLIHQQQGQFDAEGAVQSLLYSAKRKENGRETNVPVYVSAQKMHYNRDNRLLRYETNVDIQQATDRITAGVANIYLTEKNELAQTVAENNVVITQPNRRAIGDWAQYTAENEVAVLRGNPASVEDGENGTSQSGEMTLYMRDKRVVSQGKSNQNTSGRIRSVYKVKNSP